MPAIMASGFLPPKSESSAAKGCWIQCGDEYNFRMLFIYKLFVSDEDVLPGTRRAQQEMKRKRNDHDRST